MPRITAILANADGRIILNLATTPNVSSRLLAATNLTPPVIWQAVATNSAGGTWQFEETNSATQPFQVYRLSTP